MCRFLTCVAILLVGVAGTLTSARASLDDCRTNVVVQQSHFQTAYDQVLVPLFRFHYLEPQAHYGAADGDGGKETVLELDDKTLDLIADRVVRRLVERGVFRLPGGAPPPDGEVDPNPVEPAARRVTEPTERIYLRTSCSTCHSGGAAKGGLALFDDKGKAIPLDRSQWLEIIDRTSRDTADPLRMPPGQRARASKDELAAIRSALRKGTRK